MPACSHCGRPLTEGNPLSGSVDDVGTPCCVACTSTHQAASVYGQPPECPCAEVNPARTAPLFDDDYTGPRWRYGLTFRPVGAANIPAGWIIFSDKQHDGFRHGTIEYARELTTAEIEGFELAPVASVNQSPTPRK